MPRFRLPYCRLLRLLTLFLWAPVSGGCILPWCPVLCLFCIWTNRLIDWLIDFLCTFCIAVLEGVRKLLSFSRPGSEEVDPRMPHSLSSPSAFASHEEEEEGDDDHVTDRPGNQREILTPTLSPNSTLKSSTLFHIIASVSKYINKQTTTTSSSSSCCCCRRRCSCSSCSSLFYTIYYLRCRRTNAIDWRRMLYAFFAFLPCISLFYRNVCPLLLPENKCDRSETFSQCAE